MDFLPVEMKVEVLMRLKFRDRMTCRRVCLQWRSIIDDVVGLPIKITQTNMMSLFNSNMLVRTPVVSIKPGPAVSKWEGCPFSSIFLKSIYLKTKISAENWNLILQHCSALEELTFCLGGKKELRRRDHYYGVSEKDPDARYVLPLTHTKLKRIMIRNIARSDDKKISALLDNLILPKLKQCFFSVSYVMVVTLPFGFSKLQTAITSLVQRSQKCHIVTLYSRNLSMKHFLNEDKERYYRQLHVEDILVDNWEKLASHYNYQFDSLSGYIYGYTFETLVYPIMQNSILSLHHLNLDIKFTTNINCEHLNRFSNLKSLYLTGKNDGIIIENLKLVSTSITLLSLNIPLSNENLDDIFQLPELLKLELIQDFYPTTTTTKFSSSHCQAAKLHPHLQMMIMTQNNFKVWSKLESSTKSRHLNGNCWSGLKSINGNPTLRAIAFNSRMTDESWNGLLLNFQYLSKYTDW